ncbi:hypothetical protein OA2633_02536 [Oceanicaulis sp. HTCC2633]|nr:hypothetical protein OA2633_02536 [Oceanicaulis sp. HTCC2633]
MGVSGTGRCAERNGQNQKAEDAATHYWSRVRMLSRSTRRSMSSISEEDREVSR